MESCDLQVLKSYLAPWNWALLVPQWDVGKAGHHSQTSLTVHCTKHGRGAVSTSPALLVSVIPTSESPGRLGISGPTEDLLNQNLEVAWEERGWLKLFLWFWQSWFTIQPLGTTALGWQTVEAAYVSEAHLNSEEESIWTIEGLHTSPGQILFLGSIKDFLTLSVKLIFPYLGENMDFQTVLHNLHHTHTPFWRIYFTSRDEWTRWRGCSQEI